MSGFGTEKDQDRRKRRLAQLLKLPCNRTCCECGQRAPQWASVNLGLFFCIRCSGIHRNLGVHISMVRSIGLDNWMNSWVDVLERVGNERGNQYWEAVNPGSRKPTENVSDYQLEQFIRDKYIRGLWKAQNATPPHLLDSNSNATVQSPVPNNNVEQQQPQQQQQQQQQYQPQQQQVQQQQQYQPQQQQQQAQQQRTIQQQQQVQQQQQQQQRPAQGRNRTTNPTTTFAPTNLNDPFANVTGDKPKDIRAVNHHQKAIDMDFDSFFNDNADSQPQQQAVPQQQQQQQQQPAPQSAASPLDALFAPAPQQQQQQQVVQQQQQQQQSVSVTSPDPFSLLSQPSATQTTKSSILSLYDQPQQPQQYMTSPGMQMQSPMPYGYGQPQYAQSQQNAAIFGGYPQQQQQPQQQYGGYAQQQYSFAQPQQQYSFAQPQQQYSFANPAAQQPIQQPQVQPQAANNDVFAGLF